MVLTRTDLDDIKRVVCKEVRDLVNDQFENKLVEAIWRKFDEKYGGVIKNLQAELNNQSILVKKLQEKNQQLSISVDAQEQYSRGRNIRIFGLNYEPKEDIQTKVLTLLNEKMQLKINSTGLLRCHRVQAKNKQPDKPPAVLVEFDNVNSRSAVFKGVSKLKSTGISIREDLTRGKLNIVRAALVKFPPKDVWTINGKIYVKCSGVKNLVQSVRDLENLSN